jgi:hypothetical protein
MTRSIIAALGATLAAAIIAAPGCQQTGVGDPCTPEQEYDQTFAGFSEGEVNVESRSFQCLTRLCLVNHFRGRVSCPYGQDATGNAPPGAKEPCAVPGGDPTQSIDQIAPNDPKNGNAVQSQCLDRLASATVYCSCRCANLQGKTDDGSNYCTCPDDFTCTQLVTSIGAGDTGLTGAYCIKNNTLFDPNNNCSAQCTNADGSVNTAKENVCGQTQL